MKINIAFILPHNNQGIGGGDRKFGIYFENLDNKYFNKYCVCVTNNPNFLQKKGNIVTLLDSGVLSFLEQNKIDYVYFGGAKIQQPTLNSIFKKYYTIINVNFTESYKHSNKILNFIISKTDYFKLQLIHGNLKNAYVVYNPIDFENRTNLHNKNNTNYRDKFKNKKAIIGRIARAEPSKWHYLIISTLLRLQRQKNYNYGFIFAGMPLLYKKTLKLFLNKKMYDNILFLPELRELEKIAQFYASIDVFWQTSRIGESFGNVIAESFCFKVPVITDFKEFYKNNKVNKKLYDAQIELVDNKVNGYYCKYPQTIINFLENYSIDSIHSMGKTGYDKVKTVYNVKFTADTMAKILYDFGRKHLSFIYDQKFEDLEQIPGLEEVKNYEKEYVKKIKECHRVNNITTIQKLIYNLSSMTRRFIEYLYLLYRKTIKQIFKINIEK